MSDDLFTIAYSKVFFKEDYTDETIDLNEDDDLYAGIENLSPAEINVLAEEIVLELLEDNILVEDFEETLLESLDESIAINSGVLLEFDFKNPKKFDSESELKKQNTRTARLQKVVDGRKAQKRADNVNRLKNNVKGVLHRVGNAAKNAVNRAKNAGQSAASSVKSGLDKAKQSAKAGVEKAKQGVRYHGVDKHVAKYASNRGLHNNADSAMKSKNKSAHSTIRSRVKDDIKGRVKGAAQGVAPSVKSASNNVQGKLRRGISKVAGKVASGAANVAKRYSEEFDVIDIVTDFLISEGFAEDEDQAAYIMANKLNQDDIDEIIDEAKVAFPTDRVINKANDLMKKIPDAKKKEKKTLNRRVSKLAYAAGRASV